MVTTCKLCRLPYTKLTCRRGKLTFHGFPKDPKVRQQWVQIISAENKKELVGDTVHMRVCSQHFEANCFVKKTHQIVLKPNAIPTLKLKHSVELGSNGNSLTSDDISKVETITINAEVIEQTNDVEQLQRLLSLLKKQIDNQQKKIKACRHQHVRMNRNSRKLKDQLASIRDEEEKGLDTFIRSHAAHDEFVRRYFNKIEQRVDLNTVGEDFKKFSLRLCNISTDAYRYIRDRFLSCLPHERTLVAYRARARKLG